MAYWQMFHFAYKNVSICFISKNGTLYKAFGTQCKVVCNNKDYFCTVFLAESIP